MRSFNFIFPALRSILPQLKKVNKKAKDGFKTKDSK